MIDGRDVRWALVAPLACWSLLGCGATQTDAPPATRPLTAAPADPPTTARPAPSANASAATPTRAAPPGMIFIAGATFRMGRDGSKKTEAPAHDVTVAPFFIDRLEVTASAFKACFDAGDCVRPGDGEFCNFGKADRADHPINCIDQSSAAAYCSFVQKRLPDEAEWELAARGTDGRHFPWGDDPPRDDTICWARLEAKLGTCTVGSHPKGASRAGVQDMSGNVFEWTTSKHCRYDKPDCDTDELVGRGGSWDYTNPANLTATTRAGAPPDHKRDLLGVRCVRSIESK
jgi:formylglycine-generating enzyme required for sulfatase activity